MKLNFPHHSHNTKHRLALPKYSLLHKIGRDVVTDWLAMLFFGAFLTIIFLGIGYIKFVSSNKIINLETDVVAPQQTVSFDDNKLDVLISKYESKQKVRDSLQSGQFNIPDPGL